MDSRQRRLKWMMRLATKTQVPLYRLLGGGIAAKMRPKTAPPVFLLTTTGRRSGKARTVPLSYIEDDEGMIVVGSNGGLPTDPAWTANLRANPQAVVQVGRRRMAVRARFTEGEEARSLRERISEDWPDSYGAVFQNTPRTIPIIRLEVAGTPDGRDPAGSRGSREHQRTGRR